MQQKLINTKTRQALCSLLENKTTEKRIYNEPLQQAFQDFMSNKNSVTNFNPVSKVVPVESFHSESDEMPVQKTDPLLTEK